MSWIQTHTGKKFSFIQQTRDQYDLEDVAHALAHLCRYTGHTNFFYPVAQHCVYAYWIAEKEHKRAALLHDLSEAYLGDVASPLKLLLPDYRMLEERIMKNAAKLYEFEYPLPQEVKMIDMRLLQTERAQLLGTEPEPWGIPDTIKPYSDMTIEPWTIAQSKRLFLEACRAEGL